MPSPDSTWLDYEVAGGADDQTLVSRYLTADGEAYEFERFRIPDGTVGALIAAILLRADQNVRSDILRAEVAVNDRVVSARHAAIGRNSSLSNPPDWLPWGMRDGGTLR
ncbi:hypothetical protein [Embleya hyalina]|uniref:Uncharacterized protein n=1 Tax=Embleya hyalina TaxID=516124 RepID=A0A401YTV2_9ACTN|nr:hypothetical protein [Embleya hyalina]GCD97999.1 hypothetical protein EHYA_05699 [Embleya hyalina]